jgi:hypothetical protein
LDYQKKVLKAIDKDKVVKKYNYEECKNIVENTLDAVTLETQILIRFYESFAKLVECST